MSAAQERAKKISEELDALIEKAGIKQAIDRAEEGAFIPYGALGDDDPTLDSRQNNTLYFDNEFDDRRRKTRDAVFGVGDIELRKQIMSKYIEVERAAQSIDRERVDEAERVFRKAQVEAQKLPWTMAGINAALMVGLGYWVFNIAGAIGGALLGFFLGQGTIDRSRKMNAGAVRIAEADLIDVKKDVAEDVARPMTFSVNEQVFGEREQGEDYKSAFADRLQGYARQQREAAP
jgi:hypothetical protein